MNTQTSEPQIVMTPRQRLARRAGFTSFALICLIFFTLSKLPEDRIKAYIDGNISMMLADKGLTFRSTAGHLSFLFGLSYTMKDITVNFPPPASPIHVDRIVLSPSILPLLFGRYSGKVLVENGTGELRASFSVKKTDFSLSYKARKLEIQKLGILPYLGGFQAAALVDGSGSVSGDTANATTIEGEVALTLSKIGLEPQTIAGFSVPQISISEAVAEISADKGKVVIKTLRVGKPATGNKGPEDLQGAVTGDITLSKFWESSALNLKTHFTLSENVMKSFVILDAILGAGKQPDGSYSFNITGSLSSPMPIAGGGT